MLHVGLDLSRTRLDVHAMNEAGTPVLVTTAAPDAGGLASLVARVGEFGQPVAAAIESMTGARFVHDQLELRGWEVEVADAGLGQRARAAGGQDRSHRRLGARRAVSPRPGAGNLAAGSGGACRAGTRPLAAAPGAPPHRAEEPHPRHAADLRPPVSGRRPVRRRRPAAAGRPAPARAVGGRRGRRAGSHRRPRRADQRLRGGAAHLRRRPPVRAAADDRAGHRAGAGGSPSPPRSATSPGFPRRRSWSATPGCARRSTSPAARTTGTRWPRTDRSTCAGR